jgi:hypothetical protein
LRQIAQHSIAGEPPTNISLPPGQLWCDLDTRRIVDAVASVATWFVGGTACSPTIVPVAVG